MEKKYIHFFGCSFTAGHELADDEFIPQAKDCKTADEYYELIKSFQDLNVDMNVYIDRCKSLAFPNLIEQVNPDWKCVNHAELGASIKQEIYNTILIIEKKQEPVDFVVFQPPHYTREFVLNRNEQLRSYSINSFLANDNEFNEYLEKSVMFHSLNHWTIHGQIDLLLFEGYLISKNIKYIFLNLETTNSYSNRQMTKPVWKTKPEATLDLYNDIFKRTIGGHFDKFTHQNFARIIANKIKQSI